MKIHQLIKKFGLHMIFEIIDNKFRRMFYGTVSDLNKDIWGLLTNLDVIEINPFLAEVSESKFIPAIQVIVSTVSE